jgi:hypothetical protein
MDKVTEQAVAEQVEIQHERAGAELEAIHEQEGRYFDSVGRPRKLAMGAMKAIQREFESGESTTRELATRYGVSTTLILQVCYFTPKGKPKTRPEPEQMRPVVYTEHPDDETEEA